MATITDPIMLDSTGQDIKDQISALNTKIQTLNTLLADLGLVSITPISQEDYDALSQAEKLAGVFDIYDAVEPDIDGTKVAYNSNKSVVQAIDDADLREGGTITGNLIVDSNNATSTTTDARFLLGNNIPNGTTGSTRGVLSIYDKNQYRTSIIAGNGNLTTDRLLTLPDKTGTIALTSDFVKHGVEWSASGATISLDQNKFYFVCAGTNQSAYAMCYVLYDGGWVIKGTNTVNITTSGDNLKIPQYLRYLILTWE